MTRARLPKQHEVAEAAQDPRFVRARDARPDSPDWRTRALCRSTDPETFFPHPTAPTDLPMAVCRRCPVQTDCLAAALDAGDCEGVWGATTPRERRAMLVAWRDGGGRNATRDHAALERRLRGDFTVHLYPRDVDEAVRRLNAEGKSDGEIAGRLGFTRRTVTRSRARQNLGAAEFRPGVAAGAR